MGESPGDYTPETLTLSQCNDLCASLSYTYSIVASTSCYCRGTALTDGEIFADPSQCAEPCAGDANEICGNEAHVIQTKCCPRAEVDLRLDDFDQSVLVGQSVAVSVRSDTRYLPLAVDYGDGTPIQSRSVEHVRPHTYAVAGKYVVNTHLFEQNKVGLM